MNKVTLLFSAASLLFFAACTDYQEEFDNAFSGLDYADGSGDQIPGSSGDQIPESSGDNGSGTDLTVSSSSDQPLPGGVSSSDLSGVVGDTLYDTRDEKKYSLVKIGDQVWMAENLNYQTENSRCYDNAAGNCLKYGQLYTWNEAQDVCPEGTHLPSYDEFNALYKYVNEEQQSNGTTEAKFLKSMEGWKDDNEKNDGDDTYGFSALPAGLFADTGYVRIGEFARFLTSDTTDDGLARTFGMDYNNSVFGPSRYSITNAFSVRCLVGEAQPKSSASSSSSATGSSSSQPGQSSSSVSSSSMSSSSQSSSSSVSSSSMSSSSQSSSSSAKVYCFGTSYNPETQFCDDRQMAIYDYCNGEMWNPSTQYCHNNKEIRLLSECVLKNGEKLFFNPDSQYCDESEGRKKLSLCADTLIRQDEYCYTTSKAPNTIQVAEKPKCGDRLYDPLKEFCYLESSSYVKKRTICHANPNKMDSLNIDLRVSSLDGKGHNGQICDTRDYKIYGAAQIGHQIWMTQNLNYRYTNSATDSSSFCYGGDTSNCNKYGRLYTWSAAIDSTKLAKDGTICGFGKSCTLSSPVKGVCPDGWHLPTEDEFNELIAHVVTYARGNEKTAAQELKSQSGWNSANGVDAWQFSLLPAGVREEDGSWTYEGSRAYLWTSTQYTGDAPYCIGDFCAHYVNVDSGNPPTTTPGIRTIAMSVRCVQKVVEPE